MTPTEPPKSRAYKVGYAVGLAVLILYQLSKIAVVGALIIALYLLIT
jgi:hypothetical protein